MKTKLKDLRDDEIKVQLKEATKVIREERFQYAVARSLENPRKIRDLKKKVARLSTLQRERGLKALGKKCIRKSRKIRKQLGLSKRS